jgi:hypothetical protein
MKSCEGTGNEHRFMQDVTHSIKYLDPLGIVPLRGHHDFFPVRENVR